MFSSWYIFLRIGEFGVFFTIANFLRVSISVCVTVRVTFLSLRNFERQGGITCGAIDEPRKSSKAIDERVIIDFRDKNVVIARFRDKNVVIARFRDKNVLSIAFLFYKYGKYI